MVATPHGQLATELRERIQAARQRMARLAEGASGTEVCAELSDAYDDVVRQLWDAMAPNCEGADKMALVATGG